MSASIAEQYNRLSTEDAMRKLGFLLDEPQVTTDSKPQPNNPSMKPPPNQSANTNLSSNNAQNDLKDQIKDLLAVIGEGPTEENPRIPSISQRNSDRNSSHALSSTHQNHAKTSNAQRSKSPTMDNYLIKRNIDYVHNLSKRTAKRNGSPTRNGQTFARNENELNKSTDFVVATDRGRVSPEKQPLTRWQRYEEQTREPLFNVKSNNFLTPGLNMQQRSYGNMNAQDALYNISKESGTIQAFYNASDMPEKTPEAKTDKRKTRELTPTFKGDRSYSPLNYTHKEESLLSSLIKNNRPESKAGSEFGAMAEEKNKYLVEGDVFYVSSNKIMGGQSPMRSQRLAYDFDQRDSGSNKPSNLSIQRTTSSPTKNPRQQKTESASPSKVTTNQQQEQQKMEMMKYYQELQKKSVTEESSSNKPMNPQAQRSVARLNDKYYDEPPKSHVRNQSSNTYVQSNGYDYYDPNANRQLPVEPRGNGSVQNGPSATAKAQGGVKLSNTLASPEREDGKLNANVNKARPRDVSNGVRVPTSQFSYDQVEEREEIYSSSANTKNDYSYSAQKSTQKGATSNEKKSERIEQNEKGSHEMKNGATVKTTNAREDVTAKKAGNVGLQQSSSPTKQPAQPQNKPELNGNVRSTQPASNAASQTAAQEREAKEKQAILAKQEEERKKAQQRMDMLKTVESMLKEEKKTSKDVKPEKKPETKTDAKADPQKPAAAKVDIPDITSIYGSPEKKKPVAKPQPNNDSPQKTAAATNNPNATSKTEGPQKTTDPKQPADNKTSNPAVQGQTKETAQKEAVGQQKTQTVAAGTTAKLASDNQAGKTDTKAEEAKKKSDPNKVEIDKETLAKLEAALAKSNDPKVQKVMELLKKDPEKFNKILDYMEHPEKMKAEVQADIKKDAGAANKGVSVPAEKRQSVVATKQETVTEKKPEATTEKKPETTTTEKKSEGAGQSKMDEAQEKAWKEKEAAIKAELENMKQYLTYYQQYEGLYQQQQQMLLEKQKMIEDLQKRAGSTGTSGQTTGGQLPPPNLLGTQSGNTLPPPNLLGGGGGSNTLPPPNLLGGGGSTNTLPPPNLLGGGGSTNTLPPPNLLGGGSNTLPPPNLLGGGGSNILPPPNLLGGGSNTLPPPNLLGGGSNTLPPPNLLGGGSNTLPPPNLLGGGSNTLPPPNLLGGGGSNLPPPNLLGGGSNTLPPPNLLGGGSNTLPPPNLLGGGSNTLPPPNLLGGGSGGLPPPNLLGKPGGLPPPNLLGGGSGGLPPPNLLGGGPGGLPPPNLLGKPGGLPPPNLLGGGSGGLPPPNLLGGGPGGLPPPNLLGKPGGLPPPNLLGGGPGGLPPPNLLGGGGGLPAPNLGLKPPTLGAPNLLGGPPNLLGGPPNLNLGGPPKLNLGGPPNLNLNKAPTLGGPPNLNLPTTNQPKKNYKPIFWEAVPPQKFNDTIWATAYQEQVEDLKFDDIEDMFLNAPARSGGGGAGGGKEESKKVEVISLIPDSKKAYNMNIMISKFKKYTNDQMRVAIETMDPTILTVDACSTLLPFCPEKAEIDAAATYDGEMNALDPASQFIVAVHKIPRLQLRFRNNIFKGDFDEKLDVMSKDVETFRNGCVILTSNEHFRKFLKIALNIGNTLNAGTARGGAYGFKLSSLVAFMNTKGNKPNLTLLSYIVQQVYAQKPEWLDFTSEFDKLNDVSKINIDNLCKDITALKGQVQNLKGTIDMAGKANPPDSGYVNCFQPFYDTAWPKVTQCEARGNDTKTLYVQTAKYLGEDDESLKKKTSEEFFAIFVNINNSIKKTVKDEEERKKKEARAKK